ncbi:ATP-binding cassette domain-containing protein [Bifidobacterium gallicum]|uniref:ATP-binding cassette domain-containing protein n=1 Tax=Bifidobacterium gallicum TaxID=78342 RepID=UPI0005C56AF3|nr:ATP-binding cassette domain-containing protein [Bifidobacterium gallicum]
MSWHNWGYRHASRTEFAVRGLDLQIQPGERVLLVGASGIGKSTILEGAAGILGDDADPASVGDDGSCESKDHAPGHEHGQDRELNDDVAQSAVADADGGITEGHITIYDNDVHQAHGDVGLVLQDPDAQVVFQRLGDNVAFGPENLDVPREEIWQRVNESLHAVGMEGVQLSRSVLHLSGGQMQRLALAGALAMQPRVLLLDEPTANLDPDGITEVVGAVQQVLDRTHATMVLVEHRAAAWVDLIDRVVVLGLESADHDDKRVTQQGFDEEIDREGFRRTIIVADGTPEAVFTDRSIDFAELGIWVPERYRRPEDVITPFATSPAAGETTALAADARTETKERTSSELPVRDGEPKDVHPGDVVLTTQDLAIGRNGQAIAEHINLEFRAGEITALVGANGAGKSTLSLTLAGLLEPITGVVQASDALANGIPDGGTWPIDWSSRELASRISYVFQNPEHQFACSSVLDEVMLGPMRTGTDEQQAGEQAMQLLTRFHLDQYANVNPYTLSGGEKRRLTVAAALACAPGVLILDEPTFGQDRRTWMQIALLIDSLRADGVSIIVVTHDRDLVTALGARVVQLVPEFSTPEWETVRDTSSSESSDMPEADNVHQEQLQPVMTANNQPQQLASANPVSVSVSSVNDRYEEPKASSRSPFLASLNPAARLFGAFLVSLPLLLSLDVVSASVALGIEFVALWLLGITPWRVVRSTWPIFIGAPTSALAVLLYGKSGGNVWWQWAWMNVTDRSATLALATFMRILAIGIPAIVLVLGIDATDLADSFSQILHLPDRFVYGGLAGMRLFSVLRDDWSALSASRRSRGLGDENAFKAFFPQAFALLVLSIRRSTMLATAMLARGFGGSGPRSHARISRMHARDYWFLVCCVLIPVVALVTAATTGSFAFLGEPE